MERPHRSRARARRGSTKVSAPRGAVRLIGPALWVSVGLLEPSIGPMAPSDGVPCNGLQPTAEGPGEALSPALPPGTSPPDFRIARLAFSPLARRELRHSGRQGRGMEVEDLLPEILHHGPRTYPRNWRDSSPGRNPGPSWRCPPPPQLPNPSTTPRMRTPRAVGPAQPPQPVGPGASAHSSFRISAFLASNSFLSRRPFR